MRALERLPIEEPTVKKVRGLFPHLSLEEISGFLDTGRNSGKTEWIAVPPLRVDGAFHVVESLPACDPQRQLKPLPRRLWFFSAERTKKSYADGKYPKGTSSPFTAKYMNRAIQYARDHWSDDLTLDDWVDVVQINLKDPTDLRKTGFSKGSPETKAIVLFTTTRKWHDIINDYSKPRSQVIEDALHGEITTNFFVAQELKKEGIPTTEEYNCLRDGAGLLLTECTGCGRTFKDDRSRTGWYTPLPPSVAEYLISQGFEFEINPAVARKREAGYFKGRV